ncbi:MAG: ABC transporter ATP-binding protein [Burkholderiales bacterium]
MSTPAIKIQQLQKKFGSVHALQDVSMTVEQGEFFALLGSNGAGKTTLISILAGLTRADGGKAEIMGHDLVENYRSSRQLLGVVPQELAYDPFFTVRETLRMQSGYFGLRRNDEWIDEILHNLGLLDKANMNMRTLSGGMKRRVLVAQALVHKPPVIILDEPTAGVDVELRLSLWNFVRQLNAAGHTIMLTTHYLEEAEALCNRVAMLKQGRLVALDKTSNLLKNASELKLQISIKSGALPESLAACAIRQADNVYVLSLSSPADLEPVLAQLRIGGVAIETVSLSQPDLEDVFVQIMGRS